MFMSLKREGKKKDQLYGNHLLLELRSPYPYFRANLYFARCENGWNIAWRYNLYNKKKLTTLITLDYITRLQQPGDTYPI